MAYTMAEAEAEARAMAEAEAMAREMTETDEATAAAVRNINPELVSRLLAAISVLAVQPSGPAVADANHYIMSLMQTPECWPCALAALQSAPPEHAIVHGLLSLCLSLVRQARLSGAPQPSVLVPLVRQLWTDAVEVTPARRQACSLLCALACVDGHECDRLLDWCLSLGRSEPPMHLLALHLLQDVAFEVLHRPLQSKPLTTLLQEVSADVMSYLDGCAASDGLLLLCLQALQHWVHSGLVLSELSTLPNLATGLVRAMRSEGGPYAAQLAAEIMTELIGAVEALPTRPEAVRWLLRQLAADVVPALLLSLRTRCSTERERDATLRPICAVTQALMSHEAGTLLGTPTACSHTYALLSTLLGLAASRAPGTAPDAQYGAPATEGYGDGATATWLVPPPSTALLPPVWEVLLAPRGWAEIERLTRPSSGSSMTSPLESSSAHHGASERLRSELFETLLGVIVRPVWCERSHHPGAGDGWSEEDVTQWRTTTLVELCALCMHARGSARCAERLTAALAEGFRVGREAGALAASWLELEGALECAVAMVRAHRRLMRVDDGTRLRARPRGDDLDLVEGRSHARAEPFVPMGQEWHTLCLEVFNALCQRGTPFSHSLLRIGLELCSVVAEVCGGVWIKGQGSPETLRAAFSLAIACLPTMGRPTRRFGMGSDPEAAQDGAKDAAQHGALEAAQHGALEAAQHGALEAAAVYAALLSICRHAGDCL
eukprot:jgi/Chrpa1/5193/Chrysochromulina_OHIO_Genome00002608-RA